MCMRLFDTRRLGRHISPNSSSASSSSSRRSSSALALFDSRPYLVLRYSFYILSFSGLVGYDFPLNHFLFAFVTLPLSFHSLHAFALRFICSALPLFHLKKKIYSVKKTLSQTGNPIWQPFHFIKNIYKIWIRAEVWLDICHQIEK